MKTQVLLDTDIVILLNRRHEIVRKHAANYLAHFHILSFTELTWYEIVRGYRLVEAHHQLKTFESFSQNCNILSLDRKALDYASIIYADLRRRGMLIGEMDILIAGIALANEMGVATRNVNHFSRIVGLHVEDWTLANI